MVALADNAETTLFSPATRARGQRSHIDRTSSYCEKPREYGELEHRTVKERTHLGSCSRDPIGFKGGGENFYAYVDAAPLVAIDPSGKATISCLCKKYIPRDLGGGVHEYWVTTECGGLATNCCRTACGDGWFDGNFKVVPGDDAYDEAESDLEFAVMEIVICCVPTGGAGTAFGACVKGTARAVRTRSGHWMLEYTFNGVKNYAHMPGLHLTGEKVFCNRGVLMYLDEGVRKFPSFPIRYPERIPDTKCIRNCFWTVVSCAICAL